MMSKTKYILLDIDKLHPTVGERRGRPTWCCGEAVAIQLALDDTGNGIGIPQLIGVINRHL